MKKTVYISGKITGLDMHQVHIKFERAEQLLRQKGFTNIINPVKLDHSRNKAQAWDVYMKTDIIALMRCDAVYLLPCWPESEGATLEYALAAKLKYKIYRPQELMDMPDVLEPNIEPPVFPPFRYDPG